MAAGGIERSLEEFLVDFVIEHKRPRIEKLVNFAKDRIESREGPLPELLEEGLPLLAERVVELSRPFSTLDDQYRSLCKQIRIIANVAQLVDLIKNRHDTRDGSVSEIPDETLTRTAAIVVDHPLSGDTPIEQYRWLCNKALTIDKTARHVGANLVLIGEHLVQNNEALHAYAPLYMQRNVLTLPAYPSEESVKELVDYMKDGVASEAIVACSIPDETLVRTAQIVAAHPGSGDTPIRQYTWACRAVSHIKIVSPYGEAVQNELPLKESHTAHEYIHHSLKPGLILDDIDNIIMAFLSPKSALTEKMLQARNLLARLERRPDLNPILRDLTGSADHHTGAKKLSHFLSLLNELNLRHAVIGPASERDSLEVVATKLRHFYQQALDHGRIKLFEALPEGVQKEYFTDLPTEGTNREKAEYIKAQFERAPEGAFSAILEINLDHQELRLLPPEISHLTALKRLFVLDNSLSCLPNSLESLPDLEKLCAYSNKIRYIPNAVTSLNKLRVLELEKNLLTELPEPIGTMRALTDANFKSNFLTEIPQTIGKLEELLFLELSDNAITSIPDEICDLSKLRDLRLSNNELTKLPFRIGHIRDLRVVIFTHNRHLRKIPESLDALTLDPERRAFVAPVLPAEGFLETQLQQLQACTIS